MITESIFNGKTYVIPMADVSHIEKRKDIKGITIITKHTTWNAEQDNYNNSIWIYGDGTDEDESEKFLAAWCRYRAEVEGLLPSKTMEV